MASTRRRKKRCRFCKELFVPDPRLKGRQIACSTERCQKARNKANREQWLKRHPGYFEGRYENTKRWLEAHPGYLAEYRRRRPEKVERDAIRRQQGHRLAKEARADIQHSISLQAPVLKALTPTLAGADIQHSIWPQVVSVSIFSTRYAARLRRRYTTLDRLPARRAVTSPT